MKLGKVQKDTTDVTRVVVDCSKWLDQAETITTVGTPSVVVDYSTGGVPQGDGEVLYPPDNTPLTVATPTISGRNVTLMLSVGTPTLSYWVEFLVTGSSGRTKTLELYVMCNALIPSPYLVNGIYPPVEIIMLPDAPPIDPNRLWNDGNIVAVTQNGTRTTPVFNEITVTDSAQIAGYVSVPEFDAWTADLVSESEAAALAPVQTVAGRTGYITLSHNDITDWNTAAPAAAPVKTVATRTGDVVLSHNDITDWASATQHFVTDTALAVDGFAPLDSPHFTGTPTAPIANIGDASGQIATTGWFQASVQGRYAPLDSPAFINLPTGPTPPTNDSSSRLATTSFVRGAVTSSIAGVSYVANKTGNVTLVHGDISDWSGATAAFLQWNVGTVTALSASIILANGTLSAAGFSAQKFLGNYNAATNTPAISAGGGGSGGGVNGNTWVVATAGTVVADGVGAVSVSDQIVNNGSLWIKLAASQAYGSMAPQNANSVAITGGTITGLAKLGLANSASLVPSIYPDLQWGVADNVGYGLFLDTAATLWGVNLDFNSGTIHGNFGVSGALSITGSISAAAVTAVAANVTTVTASVVNTTTVNTGTLTTGRISATSGSILGQSFVGLSNGDSLAPSLYPDLAWGVADNAGNVGLWLDTMATLWGYNFNFTTGTIGALVVTGAFNPVSMSAQTITVGDLTLMPTAAPLPDMFEPVVDQNGRIASYYGGDGYFHAAGVDTETLLVNGAPVSTSSVPTDALDVASYGVVADAVECYGTVTITGGTTVAINNFTGTISLTQTTPTTATLVMGFVPFAGLGIQPYDTGSQIFLNFGTYTVQAPIQQWIEPSTVILAVSAITPQNTVVASAMWPCFTAANQNEYFVIDGSGNDKIFVGTGLVATTSNTTTPYGTRAFFSKIAQVLGPTSIVLANPPPRIISGQPAHMLWGADDTAAWCAAGQAAYNLGYRKIYARGNNRCCLLLGLGAGDGPDPGPYVPAPGVSASATLNGVLWEGDNIRVYGWDNAGIRSAKECVQRGADTRRALVRSIFKGHFKRCSQLTTINALILGDSQGTAAPPSTMAAWMQSGRIVEEFQRANPGKTINFYWEAIGGSTFASIADPVGANYTDSNATTDSWNIPRPVAGNPPYRNYWSNINQTGAGPAIVPDVVFVMNNGGNDADHMDGASMHYLINYLQNIPHADGFGPCDVLLQTDDQALFTISSSPNGGILFPSATRHFEYSTMMIRSAAASRGLGCIDMAPIVETAIYGWNPMQLAMRQVPSQTVAATPANPCVLPYECRDFSAYMTLSNATDAQIDIQVSSNHGNRIMLRFGANGHLWIGAAAFGDVATTTCTIANGGTALTVGFPVTLAGASYSNRASFPTLNVPGAGFTVGDIGKCLVAPMGHPNGLGYTVQRTFIRGCIGADDVTLQDLNYSNKDILSNTGNITYGGAQFLPADSYSQPDLVIFYPDGTIFNTHLAYGTGYVSATSANLADPAPEPLTGQSVPVFIGRMGIKWTDTGIAQSSMAAGDILDFEISRHEFTFLYQSVARSTGYVVLKRPIERWGGAFYPVFRPVVPQTIALSSIFIDDPDRSKVQPACTPFELRGVRTTINNWYQGGVGGHPSSNLRTRVTDALFDSNNLSTW